MSENNIEFKWSWRSLAAIVFLVVCVFDLIIMPTYREYRMDKLTVNEIIQVTTNLEPASQVQAINALSADRTWKPITSEMFYACFGAILGVSAWPTMRKGSGFMIKPEKEKDIEGRME